MKAFFNKHFSTAIVFFMTGLLILLIYGIWHYSEILINQQKKSFLTQAHAMKFGIETFLREEKLSASAYFSKPGSNALPEALEDYRRQNPTRRMGGLLLDQSGTILFATESARQFSTQTLYAAKDEVGETPALGKAILIEPHQYAVPLYIPLKEPHYTVVIFLSLIEIGDYLNQIMADYDGYAALKTENGYIISHPNPSQIGFHMVQDRIKKYPELDFSDYNHILQMQLTGKEGTAVYESYWFKETPVVQGKKVATFTPIYLDHEFWVLTLNLKYDTYLGTYRRLLFILLGLTTSFMIGLTFLLLQRVRSQARQREITEQYRYLKALSQARDRLRLEREQKIRAMKEAQLGIMAAKISHDLKNFLIPILGSAEFIQEDPDASESIKEDAGMILEYGEKARELTKQLSQIGRRETVSVKKELLDLSSELKIFQEAVQKALPSSVTAIFSLAPELGILSGNENEWQRVLWNLAKNAFDAMKDGGVLYVTAKRIQNQELPETVSVLNTGSCCRLEIKDTGCGMDKSIQKHIFRERFTTKPAEEGSGLGLSMVYETVTKMGGDIQVESAPGQGSTFTLYLPVQ